MSKTIPVTPADVLKCLTPGMAAMKFAAWLRDEHGATGYHCWKPAEAEELGWGKRHVVCWEGGPYDWPCLTMGCEIGAGAYGTFSKPGPFPDGLRGDGWFAESVNAYMVAFYPAEKRKR